MAMPNEFERPVDGGSYQRLPNGNLRRVEASTAPALGKSAQRRAAAQAIAAALLSVASAPPESTTESEPHPRHD